MMTAMIITGYATKPEKIKYYTIDPSTSMMTLIVESGGKLITHKTNVIIYLENGEE